jgi:hypothetical protein
MIELRKHDDRTVRLKPSARGGTTRRNRVKRWHVVLAVVAVLATTASIGMILGGKTLFRLAASPAVAAVTVRS